MGSAGNMDEDGRARVLESVAWKVLDRLRWVEGDKFLEVDACTLVVASVPSAHSHT